MFSLQSREVSSRTLSAYYIELAFGKSWSILLIEL